MLCQWPACSQPAGAIEWCGKMICDKHMRTIDSTDVRESRRILDVEDIVKTGFKFVGVTPFQWPRNVKTGKKPKSQPIF